MLRGITVLFLALFLTTGRILAGSEIPVVDMKIVDTENPTDFHKYRKILVSPTTNTPEPFEGLLITLLQALGAARAPLAVSLLYSWTIKERSMTTVDQSTIRQCGWNSPGHRAFPGWETRRRPKSQFLNPRRHFR